MQSGQVATPNSTTALSPLISVIMPCYKSTKTVADAVRSVRNQTYKNFELFCIDDASGDGTYNLLLSLASQDKRIKAVANTANLGLGGTRNHGLDIASGEYVCFLDDDDYFEPDFLEILVAAVTEYQADIAQCKFRYVFSDSNSITGSPAGLIEGEHCKYRVDTQDGLPYVTPQAWNKLYKRELFAAVRYKSILYEDAEIITGILAQCKRVVTVAEALCNYNKRFSRITGDQTARPELTDKYLSSLMTSVLPFTRPEVFQLVLKWNVPLPAVMHANHSNYFRSLDKAANSLSDDQKKLIKSKIERAVQDLKAVIPAEISRQYFSKLYQMKKALGAKSKIAALTASASSDIADICLSVAEFLLPLIDTVTPKKKNNWIFSTWGHYPRHTLDNPRAVFEFVKNDDSIRKTVLMNRVSDTDHFVVGGTNVHFVRLKSFRGLWELARAGKLWTAYSLHNVFGLRRLPKFLPRDIIQLWHGIPLKRVGLRVPERLEPHWRKEASRYTLVPSSSQSDFETMQASFGAGIRLTGLPRHDLLELEEDHLPVDFQEHLKSLRARVQGRKLVLFAPTWRYADESPCMFSLQQFLTLNDLFKKHNSVLAVRMHRHMMESPASNMLVSENIIPANDLPDVSVLLREACALVSDYSSLFLDYMKLRRPVLLYTPDLDIYRNNRGFNYPSDEFLPHAMEIKTFDTLIVHLDQVLSGQHKLDEKYIDVYRRFHAFETDAQSSRRVVEALS